MALQSFSNNKADIQPCKLQLAQSGSLTDTNREIALSRKSYMTLNRTEPRPYSLCTYQELLSRTCLSTKVLSKFIMSPSFVQR